MSTDLPDAQIDVLKAIASLQTPTDTNIHSLISKDIDINSAISSLLSNGYITKEHNEYIMLESGSTALQQSFFKQTGTSDVPDNPLCELTGFQRDVLMAVAWNNPNGVHGLEIKRVLEPQFNSEIRHGRLYPNLDTLVEKGFLTKEQLDRRTNMYAITPSGRTLINEYISYLNSINL